MKKSIFTLALAAALSLGASAQLIPNTFNYQGVYSQANTQVEVTFQIINENEYTVYQEDQSVTTAQNGAFTAVIGEGIATRGTWNELDWTNGNYTLITFIGGKKAGVCAFHAVPYANVAGTVVGLAETQQDVLELTEDNMSNKAAIAQLQQDLESAGQLANKAGEVAAQNMEDIFDLQQQVELLYSEEDGPIASVTTLATQLSNKVDGIETTVDELKSNVEILFSEEDGPIASLQLGLTQLNNLVNDELDAVKTDLNTAGELANKAGEVAAQNMEDIFDLQQQVELLYSEEDGPIASLNAGFTQLNNVVTDLDATVAELQSNVELLYSEEDGPIAALQQGLTQLTNLVNVLEQRIAALEAK